MAAHRFEVLVVDDLPEICDFLTALLRRARHLDVHLTTEVNSDRALDLVRTHRYDLVLSDYRMREVDGVEVLSAARRAHPAGVRVLMTGYNEIPATLERIRDADVDAYVQKPLKGQDLLLLLLGLLNRTPETLEACRAHARELEAMALREERSGAPA